MILNLPLCLPKLLFFGWDSDLGTAQFKGYYKMVSMLFYDIISIILLMERSRFVQLIYHYVWVHQQSRYCVESLGVQCSLGDHNSLSYLGFVLIYLISTFCILIQSCFQICCCCVTVSNYALGDTEFSCTYFTVDHNLKIVCAIYPLPPAEQISSKLIFLKVNLKNLLVIDICCSCFLSCEGCN